MEMAKDGYLSLQRKRHDFLGDVVSSHSTICPCQNLTQWGLVWPLHSKCNIDSKPWGSNQGQQRANMLRKVNNSPECVCVWKPETWMLCSHSKQTLFIRLPEVMGFPDGLAGKEPFCNAGDAGLIPELGRFNPWKMKWQPIPVFLPEKSHGHRSLVGYSSKGTKESDTTDDSHFQSLTRQVLRSWTVQGRIHFIST